MASLISHAEGSNTTGQQDVVCNVPAAGGANPTGVGDLLVAVMVGNSSGGTWTERTTSDWGASVAAQSSITAAIFSMLDDGSMPSSYTFRRSNTSGVAGFTILRYPAGSTLYEEDALSVASASSTTLTHDSLTCPAGGGEYYQWQIRVVGGATTWTPPGSGGGTAGNPDVLYTGITGGQYALGMETAAAGATGTRAWSNSNGSASRGANFIIQSSTVAVDPDDAAHAHSATSPTLTQHQVLTPDSATHAHAATSPALTQHHVLTPADALHAHSATEPTLTQHHVVDPDDATHAHAASSPSLIQHHVVAPDDAVHGHTATEPTVTPGTPATASVQPDDAVHGHTATSPALIQHQTIQPADALHTHSAASPTLTQHHALTPHSATHGHTASSPTVTPATVVEPDDAFHTHAASSPTIVQRHVLTPHDAVHGHVATSPTLTQHHVVAPDSAFHTHTATSPELVQPTTTPASRTSYAQPEPVAVGQPVVDVAVAQPVVDVAVARPDSTSTSST